jgi:tetratricopeptide (TPR) repeat protein
VTTKLENLVRQATVPLVDPAGTLLGTAFFVAPGIAVTAAHVVRSVVDDVVFALDRSGDTRAMSVQSRHPSYVAPGVEPYPLPDLAVLVAQPDKFDGVPCVLLEAPGATTSLLALGYSRSIDPRAKFGPDLASLEVEGIIEEQGVNVLKVKQATIDPGMSGAPVLDRVTGAVVGVVKATRGVDKPYGGYIVDASELRHLEHSVWAQSELHHRTNATWRSAKAGDYEGPDPVAAVRDLLDAVVREADSRRETLPDGVNTEALHQTIWLRRRGGREDGLSPRMRWRVERTLSGLTVVSGDPGLGKSWLLAHQATESAGLARRHLDSGGEIDDCVIPVRLSCATLAADQGYGAEVHGLARKLVAAMFSHGQASPEDRHGYVAVVERALTDGRALLCVDGLDEMPSGLRSQLKHNVVTLLSLNNALLIGSRPVALPIIDELAAGNREDFELIGFSTRERVNFVRAWLADRPAALDTLLGALTEHSELAQLAEVPLLLSFLCRLTDSAQHHHYRRATLSDLYRDVAMHFLSGRWHGDRSPVDLESQPDSVLRMRLLAEALGDLQDSWRGGVEDIPRSDLRAAIRRHPEYETVASTAKVRMKTHQTPDAFTDVADAVLWELLYDGILVDASDTPMRPTVRFIHPILRETLLATYFARLPHDQQLACIDRHRWLDPGWTRVFVSAARVITDSAALIAHVISEPGDPWVTQRMLAAQLIAEAPDFRDAESAAAVRDAILHAARSRVVFERRRAIEALGMLLRSSSPPLRNWARERASMLDEPIPADEPDSRTVRIDAETEINHVALAALVDVGDDAAVCRARQIVISDRCPEALRRRLLAGLVALDTQDTSDLVFGVLERPNTGYDMLTAFLSVLRPQSRTAIAAAVRLLRDRRFRVVARLQVGRALMECGSAGVDAVRAAADDRTVQLSLRCRLYAELIRGAVPDTVAPAMRLLANQQPTYADRAEVTLALVEDGVSEAISHAASALVNRFVHWTVRESIARALARQGVAGRDLLAAQIDSGAIPLGLKVRHVCALVEVHDSRGSAAALGLHNERGLETWIRVTLAVALVRYEPTLADEEALIELATATTIEPSVRLKLVVEMARHGLPSTEDVLTSLLRERRGAIDTWPDTSRRLAEAGPVGQQCLDAVAGDAELDWDVRCEALLAVGRTYGGMPRHDALAEMPAVWRKRLVLGLAHSGLAPDLDEFISVARGLRGGYRIIFEFLQRAAVDNHAVDALMETARELQSGSVMDKDTAHESLIKFDAAMLTELGIESRSEAEARQHLQWIYDTLELRVSKQISRLMLAEQMEEFDAYANDESAALSFLELELPEYGMLVQDALAALKDEIRNGTLVPPPVGVRSPANISLLSNVSRVAAVLSEWVATAHARRWDRWRELTLHNAELIGSELSRGVLHLTSQLDPTWGLHEAATFVADRLAQGDYDMVFEYSALIDWLKIRLEEGDYARVRDGGLFATFRYPEKDLGWLYAAAGAEQTERHRLAVALAGSGGQARPPSERHDGSTVLDQFQLALDWSDEITAELRNAYLKGVETTPLVHYEQAVAREPNAAARHFDLAIALQRDGRPADAVTAYQRAAELDVATGWRHRALASALAAVGRYDEALAESELAIELEHSDHLAHAVRAEILSRLQRYEDAVGSFAEARRLNPANPLHVTNLAIALASAGRSDDAISMLRDAIATRPKSAWFRCALADVLGTTGRFDEAQAEADLAVQADPTNARAHSVKGRVLHMMGRANEAEEWLRAATQMEATSAHHWHALGLILYEAGQYSEAADAFRRTIRIYPANPQGLRILALVELALGREAEADDAIEAALALDPSISLTHDTHGRMLAMLDRYDEAAAALAEAVRLDPVCVASRANYAEALILCGQLTEAEPELRKARELGPANSIEAALLLAVSIYQRDTNEATALAREALECAAQPTITQYRHGELRAIARLLLGDLDGAISEIHEVAGVRGPTDHLQRPLYGQLRAMLPPESVDALLAAWP